MPLKPVEVAPAAADELRESELWYSERSDRAGLNFVAEFETAVSAIRADPDRFGNYLYGCRRRRLKKYPFLVVYRELADRIQIVAVAHTRRRPGYWRDRVR